MPQTQPPLRLASLVAAYVGVELTHSSTPLYIFLVFLVYGLTNRPALFYWFLGQFVMIFWFIYKVFSLILPSCGLIAFESSQVAEWF